MPDLIVVEVDAGDRVLAGRIVGLLDVVHVGGVLQVRVSENPTHAFLGQWYSPTALRKNVTGNLESPVTIFWNIEKK